MGELKKNERRQTVFHFSFAVTSESLGCGHPPPSNQLPKAPPSVGQVAVTVSLGPWRRQSTGLRCS